MEHKQPTGKKFTRPEAAEYIGVAPRTLANWHSSGRVKIPFYKVGRKKTIYMQSDLDAFLASVRTDAEVGNA